MREPVIGLNCDVTEPAPGKLKLEMWRAYAAAVELAGGVPVVLPPVDAERVEAQLAAVNGLVLIGGRDYDPAMFGAKAHAKTDLLHPVRQAYDVALAKAAVRRGMPVLGICGGLQLINVACGGTLVQHVPDAAPQGHVHSGPAESLLHEVLVDPETRLHSIVKAVRFGVNSTHHQSADRIGSGLRACARSTDGIIEGIEGTDAGRFLVCVQWHPERLTGDERQLGIFRALVGAVAKERRC